MKKEEKKSYLEDFLDPLRLLSLLWKHVVLILTLTAQQVLDKPTLGLLNRRASGRQTQCTFF